LDPFSPFVRQLRGAKRRYLVLFNSRASGGIFDLFQYAEKRKENCFSTVVFLHTKRMYSLRDVHVHSISDEDEKYVKGRW
jgi:hypothetical protein